MLIGLVKFCLQICWDQPKWRKDHAMSDTKKSLSLSIAVLSFYRDRKKSLDVFCSCCCLSPLPQLACSILPTTYKAGHWLFSVSVFIMELAKSPEPKQLAIQRKANHCLLGIPSKWSTKRIGLYLMLSLPPHTLRANVYNFEPERQKLSPSLYLVYS